MAKGRRKKRNSKKLRKLTRTRTLSAKPPEELWADRRAGARNIAGVRYQLRLTLTVLVRAAHGQFPASALMPEGMEDIDTLPTRGEKHRFLQAKELGSENRILGMGALADFLEHTIPILRRDPDALGVLITNGFFGGGLEATGWDATLDPTDELTQTLAEVIDGIDADELDAILPRISLVEETADLDVIVHEIASLYAVDPMIAQLALDRCLAIVIDTSAEQAFTSIDKPVTLAINDLQGAVHEAKRAVATSRLSIDDLHGVVAPLTFRVRSQLTERQFLEGVDVRPEHIAADLDVPRSEYLDEIARGIEKTQLVVILGPSGAGKSALLWRAAAEHATKMRVWRVQQLAETHVDVLVAAVEQQRPSSGFPILLCVDDVGRPNRAGWRHAAATLLELQGVYLLAAAREEDFTTEDALRRALIVRPTLNRQTARRIEEILSARGVIPAMAVDEAFPRSRGLLMEFLHLVIAGRRLSAVLAEQAVGLEESTRQTELAVARYVTSAHSVGLEVDAETLDGRLATSELAAALRRLEHEHLLVESVTGTWTGLHELRSTELSQLLHQRPPPRLADTLAQVVTDASTRAAAARLPLIMRTAKAAEPIAAALAARVKGADSTEASVWLEGARLADVSEHARECAAVARRLPLPAALNVQQWLVIACLGRFAGVDLSILPAESRAHAAQLPEPRAQLHRQAASGIDPSEWAERARSADTATRARLLEALEGAVQWDSETATSLAASVPSADSLADARVVASIHRGCRDDAARAGLIASLPSPSQRLQALRDVWPLLTEAEFVPATGVVETRFIHPVNGSESPEARAAELAAVLLDLLPEAATAEVTVTRYDGADLPILGKLGPHKAIPRKNHYPHAITRWNRAFGDCVEHEFSSPSVTVRLREQAIAVALATQVVVGIVERMMRFDYDERRLQRAWTRTAERLVLNVAGLKGAPPSGPVAVAPLGSPPRERDDEAAQALEAICTATRLLTEAISEADFAVRRHKMRLVGANLRTAAGHYSMALAQGTARLSGEPDPLDLRLLDVLEDAASCTIGYADGVEVTPPSGRFTAAQLRVIAEGIRDEQRQAERRLLDETVGQLPGVDTTGARIVEQGNDPMLVPDPKRWLLPTPPSQLAAAADALLGVTSKAPIAHPLAFRVILAPARGNSVYNYPGTVIGTKAAYPIDLDEMRNISAQAGLPMYPGRCVEEVAQCIEALVRASRAAIAAQAVDGTQQAPPLRDLSRRELHQARCIIATIALDDIALPLGAVADLVAHELGGTDTGALASEFDEAHARSISGPRIDALEAATQAAALST